ncbi:SEC10/PgrA surface exclusion domain-containing protein [Streptococcus agalactiae]|nr:SEC10/PgrA surface exclusion domain-containing protein [Streptococcus agalactiae]MCC9713899.1 SEC10/PgrA surface exclusion domain-containing protein [Streptococcus agalactiae]MCC9747226.1 SEC10/PgrA surface exclusion domain-containing protein [Streptococcus agalactiae]
MSKNIKLVSGLAVAVVGTSVGASVNADTVETQPVVENTVEVVAPLTETVTQQDIAKSEAELKVAEQAVSEQEKVVEAAQNNADSAQSEVSEAKEQVDYATELVNEASPEKVSKAEQAIKDQEVVVTDNETEILEAEQAVADANQAVTEQEAGVSKATQLVEAAQTEVDSANKDVETAQNALDGTGEATLIAEKEQAKLAKDEANAKVSLAEGELVKAKEADKNAATQLEHLETSVRNDQVDVDKTKSVLDEAIEKATETAAKVSAESEDVTTAKAQVEGLEAEINNKNTINLPAGYAEALKQFIKTKWTKADSDKLAVVANPGEGLNTYKSNPADKLETIADVNNLSQSQREELTSFAVDLINQVRTAMGTTLAVANNDAIAFADEVANTSAKTGDEALGHDTTAIPTAAAKFGLVSNMGQNNYENWSAGHYTVSDKLTMDDLKKGLYETIVAMLFDDETTWGHATSLAGIRTTLPGGVDSKYVGVDFSTALFNGNYTIGRIHILGVSDVQIEDDSKFDISDNLASRDLAKELSAAKEALSREEQELATAKEEDLVAQGHQASAQLDYDKALSELAKDKEQLAFYQNYQAKTPQAEINYATAVEELKSAELRLDKAQKAIDNLSADIKVKEQELADAKAILSEKEQALINAKDELNAETSLLEELKDNAKLASKNVIDLNAKLATEKAELAKLVQYLEDLKNAPSVLEKALADFETAQSNLTARLDDLQRENDKLKSLKAVQAELSEQHSKIVEAYKKVLAAQAEVKRQQEEVRKAKEESERQKQLMNVSTGVAQRHANPITSQYGFVKSENHSNNEVSGNATFDLFTKKGDSKSDVQLPQTGEESSLLAVAGAMLLGTLGLAGTRKRRN